MTNPDPNAIFNEDEVPKTPEGSVVPEDTNSDVPKNTADPAKQEPSPLDKWVGEGKKYSSVEQAIAALDHSQAFIEQLQRENADMRRELSSQEKLDELLSRIGTSETPPHKDGGKGMEGAGLETPDGTGHDGEKKSFTQEELSELVRSEVTRMEEKRTAEQNELEASNKIVELAGGDGAKATQFVKQAAEELGVSVRYLRQQAQISPSAFVRLVSATATKGNETGGKETPNVVSGRGQNTEALPNKGQRPSGSDVQPYSHWKKLRKELSAREYYSPSVQNAMMRSRQQLGEAFYDA